MLSVGLKDQPETYNLRRQSSFMGKTKIRMEKYFLGVRGGTTVYKRQIKGDINLKKPRETD